MNRRAFLRGVTVATVVGVAGCTGGGSNPATTTTTTTTDTTVTTATTTETTTTGESPDTTTTTDDGAGTTTTATTTTTPTTTTEPAVPSTVEVSVGADGVSRFTPEEFTVQQGGTVTWVWEGNGHNVLPSSQPEAADWSGTEGGNFDVYDEGHTHEYTFEVPGEYDYYCSIHRPFGMVGSFTVE